MNPTRSRREPPTETPARATATRSGEMAPAIDSRALFRAGTSTVEITHGDSRYVLRVTRDNKLILTK